MPVIFRGIIFLLHTKESTDFPVSSLVFFLGPHKNCTIMTKMGEEDEVQQKMFGEICSSSIILGVSNLTGMNTLS